MKKALMTASMASMLDNFNTSNIELLDKLGYEITLAANFEREDSSSQECVQNFRQKMQPVHEIKQIDFTRKISNIRQNIISYKQLKKLAEEDFSLVHCHSPICAAMTRAAFRRKRKNGTKIIYTAHGFHFYKGAPWKNWFFFFPIEWVCSWWTDVIITINQEDFALAKRFMRSKRVEYISGVGIDYRKIKNAVINKKQKRRELGIPEKAVVLISVGEVNKNKNHIVILKALKHLQIENVYYLICGHGALEKKLKDEIKNMNMENQVKLLGFRTDIVELLKASDIFAFPSRREGLGIAALEAMAAGLPLVTSDSGGIMDYMVDGKTGYCMKWYDVKAFARRISQLIRNSEQRKRMGNYNIKAAELYDVKRINKKMEVIYRTVG